MSTTPGGHRRIDRRSLALHRAIAEKLRVTPALIQVARDNLDRWSRQNGRSQPYWDAWREILDKPIEDVLTIMVEESERLDSLRQATPFAGILTPAQRWAIYQRFESKHARTA
ncbi:MAG TPA: hypothetical protein VN736_05530 [Candidatus Limnocylindrales bacterium]|nr:hypothetical protein [Candidatus Limnocylindrales bacterium]